MCPHLVSSLVATTSFEIVSKPPYQPNGSLAASTGSDTWVSYQEALAAYNRGGFNGVGFVLTDDDPYTAWDLDHCVNKNTGEIAPWALEIVQTLNSYTEISPSGEGLRILVKATLPKGRRKKGSTEVYCTGRYVNLTGNHLTGTPATIEYRDAEVHALHRQIFGNSLKERPKPKTGSTHLDDNELLRKAAGASNGVAFSRLFARDTSGYNSRSEADLALCSHLAFYSQGDRDQILRLFRRSGLYRDKWDERHFGDGRTYGDATIDKALEGRSFYSPDGSHPASVKADAEPGSQNEEWEPPLPFNEVAGPPFPVDALPGQVRAYVQTQSEAIQVPLDLTGCLVLGVTSAACRGLFEVGLNPEWHELVCDYFVPALPSGERKSQRFKRVTAPLEERERELVKAAEPEIERAKTEKEIMEKRLQELKNKAAKETREIEAEVLTKDAAKLAVELQNMKVPKSPRLIADDATAEAITKLMDDYDGTIAIMSTEGGLFDTIAGRYSDGVANLDIFTKAYTGDAHRTDRSSNQPRLILRPCLTLCISPQPDVLIGMGKNRVFRVRGFLARMKFSVPRSMVGYRSNNAEPVPDSLRQHWYGVVRNILRIPPSPDGKPQLLHLSDDAFRLFHQYRDEVEIQLRPGGQLKEIDDWGNRLPGTVARHAALLHILERAEREDLEPWNTTISADTVSAAIRLARYFTEHALIAFALMRNGGRATLARKIWDFLMRQPDKYGERPFRKSLLWMNLRNSFQDKDEFNGALKELEDMNYIRQLPPPQRKVGRRPSPSYEVNPLAINSIYSLKSEFVEYIEFIAKDSGGIEDSSQRGSREVVCRADCNRCESLGYTCSMHEAMAGREVAS
jgi:hypothetical protein